MLLTYLLQRNGVPADAVSVTSIGTAATAVAAMEYGKVDAGVMADPSFTMVAKRNPRVRVLADLRTRRRRQGSVRHRHVSRLRPVLVRPTGCSANRDTAARLARAIVRTLEWMQTHTPEEIAAKTPKAFRGDDDALYVEALKASMPMFSPDGKMSTEGAEAVRTLLAGSLEKVRTATIDLSKTYHQRIHPWTLKQSCSSASPECSSSTPSR